MDVMLRVASTRYTCPEDLYGHHPQVVPGLDFRSRVVTDYEHLGGFERVNAKDLLKDSLFTLPVGFVNRVNIDRLKERPDPERPDLTVLETPEAGCYQE